jgi:ParB family protein of integrating conjugative element (PFGI_1 class)
MPEPSTREVADKLLATGFTRSAPDVPSVTDPIADTPMVVTLDQLRPYELNPRVTRNPRYDDIKASIRERKLDAPPPITRRPGESHYIIRNGGNTRLEILNQLWAETRNEEFFRILCLFRPWTADGEIVALTGHLAENELRGNLTFIERALGVEKAREIFQKDTEKPLTQMDLARRLTAYGYPITQSHISRLQDAVRYLLPAIPSVLYAGLGKPQIDRLTALRKTASRSWERYAQGKPLPLDFSEFFQETLALFDAEGDAFSVQRVQDEFIGQMARLLSVDYDALALEMIDPEVRHHALNREPGSSTPTLSQPSVEQLSTSSARANLKPPFAETPTSEPSPRSPSAFQSTPAVPERESQPECETTSLKPSASKPDDAHSDSQWNDRLQAHIVSPAQSTDRLQAIQRTIAAATGESLESFPGNVVRAVPVQAGGLHPISDVWYIEPGLDAPDRLRTHIAQLAREIAQEANFAERIEAVDNGIGFLCIRAESSSTQTPLPMFERAVLTLLGALSAPYANPQRPVVDGVRLADDLGPLLQGSLHTRRAPRKTSRISDAGVVKLFRLIRLARRVVELESSEPAPADDPTGV